MSKTSIKSEDTDEKSIEEESNMISNLFLFYLNPLFVKGYKETIELTDLGCTSKQDKPKLLYFEFIKQFELEKHIPLEKRSLWWPLWRTVGYNRLFLAISLYAGYTACSFGPILILTALVQNFSGEAKLSTPLLWILVSLMFILPMLGTLFAAHSNIILAHIGLQFRNILIDAIYRKSLKISSSSRAQTSTGQIVNMFSNDTRQLQGFLFFINNLILAPFTIGVCLYLIYQQVGVATFVGLGLIIASFPLNGYIFNWLNEVRRAKVKLTDKRVKLMNEVLNGIRIIKYYAWELAFRDKVSIIREEEVVLLRKIAYIVAVAFSLVLSAVPLFMPVLIFYTYVKLGNQLDATKAFTAIALFNLMQFPFVFLPLGLSSYNQSLVSTTRIMTFLNSPDLESYVAIKSPESVTDNIVIRMEDVHASWCEADLEGNKEEAIDASVPLAAATAVANQVENTNKESTANDSIAKEVHNIEDVEVHVDDDTLEQKPLYDLLPEEDSMPNPEDTSLNLKSENTSDTKTHNQNNTDIKDVTEIPVIFDKVIVNRSVNTLMGIDVEISKGELVAVVGSVGSGKSSFLSALLGEMILLKGKIEFSGSVAYCDQRPWILNDTVQNNVTFGLPYNEQRFDDALHYSSLEDDIVVLPGGINTQIGERGINLSGGQKARVAFARAVYRDADVYILDDVLSAVDAHVGQFLFHEGIRNGLKGKTRIFVTHQIHILPYCDKIIILDNGIIKACGNYNDLKSSGVDISTFIPQDSVEDALYAMEEKALAEKEAASKVNTVEVKEDFNVEDDVEEENKSPIDAKDNKVDVMSFRKKVKPLSSRKLHDIDDKNWYLKHREKSLRFAAARKDDNRESTISSKEEKNEGDVTTDIYLYYVKAGGVGLFSLIIFFVLVAQLFVLLASYWLSYWGTVSRRREDDGHPLSSSKNIYYLNIFAVLSCVTLICYLIRSLILANHRLKSSKGLHEGILTSTLLAPVSFFDVTPIGRILNRFSSDMQVVDEDLLQTISQGLNGFANVLGAIGAIAGATKGTFLILVVPMGYFYNMVQKYFRATNTAIARVESVSRSPIYADFSQALNGVGTIRAFADSDRFIDVLEELVERNSIANVTQQLSSQWLAIRLDSIGAFISFFIAVLAASTNGFIPASFVALGLTYSFQLTTYLKFLVRMLSTGEAQMNSVERIKYYMDNIEREGSQMPLMDVNLIPPEWPEKGEVLFNQISMRYREGPLVLKSVNALVESNQKVGLAGRTGSGKSSLMIALFRIQELASGKIIIDELDISKVPLSLLRSKLGIIPQDPVMFSATVRFNLDPFEKYSDVELWDVLESINMKEHVLSLPNKLQEEVAESGDNFSAGQRQLICIARAILRKPKILVLDEATASIDNETDLLIQKMIREQFKECTVLTIAHRLNTIIDSDKIMVLDDGNLVEYDAPTNLLENPEGIFNSLWKKHLQSHGDKNNSSTSFEE